MRTLVAAIAFAVLTAGATAQEWPRKPVHMIVPQSPGSASDIVTRTVVTEMSKTLGQQFIVENRVGAGNTIAMGVVARAEPDGYTVLVNSATHSLVPVTYTKLPFDTFRDLVPVIPLGNSPLVLVVQPAKGYQKVTDLVSRAKAAGGAINFSGGGTGSLPHLAAEAFRLAAGFGGVHIPFKGAPEALTEVVTGRIDFYFSPLPPATPLLRDGKVQALAVTSSTRAGALPAVPTLSEVGYPDATYNFWIGLFVPAGTPEAIIDRLYSAAEKALQVSNVRERFAALGVDELPLDRAGFRKLIQEEFERNKRIVKAAGLKIN